MTYNQICGGCNKVGIQDILYDLTCGTGGFLVASLDIIKARSTL